MYDLDWLLARTARKQKTKYLYFWGHRPTANGTLSGSCLSQWWASPFEVDGVRYATAEHWMMAGKARLFGDDGAADRIVKASHPDCAKRLGREVRDFDQDRWDERRFDLVVEGNRAKFSQHPDLREFLLGTGERVLVEASPVDRIWGAGLAADDDRIPDGGRRRRPSRRGPRRGAPAQGGAHEHGERVVRGPLQQKAQDDEGQSLGRIGQDDELVAGLEPELLAGLRRQGHLPALTNGDGPEEPPAVGADMGGVARGHESLLHRVDMYSMYGM